LKQKLVGVFSGLLAGALLLTVLFLGPLKPSSSNQVSLEPSSDVSNSAVIPAEPTQSEVVAPKCSVAELEADPAILQLQAEVRDAATNQVLFERSASVSARPASVQKLLTAAAAYEVLGPSYRVVTRIYQDALNPGVLYFVGAGDPTLSRLTADKQSVYRNAAKLEVLAAQVNRVLRGTKVSRIVLDSSLFGGDSGDYLPAWDPRGLTEGYMPRISALQVDADRDNPAELRSSRSKDPVLRAGTWLQKALGSSATNAELVKGKAALDAKEIAQVSSQPISEWVNYMLRVSDNTVAESLGRLISLDLGLGGAASSVDAAIKTALRQTPLDLSGVVLEDASGLSRYNQLSAALTNDLLQLVRSNYNSWGLIREGLPVSGSSGSLSGRFPDLQGKVVAKSGWIRTGYTLAGYLEAADRSTLVFTVYNLGDSVNATNREALDALVAGFQACGLALDNR
jgi:serine-type D-Ala-D-Ala carboxypeptidase/endopeptidase (penicillin-binding protein 4)